MDQRVSRACFDAATVMAKKLEGAVNKLMLTVGDRVERQRRDHNNAEREIEAAKRVDKEHIRAQWDSEVAKVGEGSSDPSISVSAQRIHSLQVQSYLEVVKQQKALSERQRKDSSNMQRSAASSRFAYDASH